MNEKPAMIAGTQFNNPKLVRTNAICHRKAWWDTAEAITDAAAQVSGFNSAFFDVISAGKFCRQHASGFEVFKWLAKLCASKALAALVVGPIVSAAQHHVGCALAFLIAFVMMAATAHGADFLLAIDLSGSMQTRVQAKGGSSRAAVVQEALRNYLGALPLDSRVKILTFNDRFQEREAVVHTEADRHALLDWIGTFEAEVKLNRGTRFYEALRRALTSAQVYARQNPHEYVQVHAFTDGEDDSRIPAERAIPEILRDFPEVDGSRIRANLVLSGDWSSALIVRLEQKLRPLGVDVTDAIDLGQPILPPVIVQSPDPAELGQDTLFADSSPTPFGGYEWLIDGRPVTGSKSLRQRFDRIVSHRLTLVGITANGRKLRAEKLVEVVPHDLAVSFAYFPNAPEPGQEVRFIGRAIGKPVRWEWSLNGRIFGQDQDVKVVFPNSGTFEVSVLVADGTGTTATATNRIEVVAGQFSAHIKAPAKAKANDEVQFASEVVGKAVSYRWEFDDGSGSNDQNPLHRFVLVDVAASNKVFNVRLTVVGIGGRTATAAHSITVVAPPKAQPPRAGFKLLGAAWKAGERIQVADDSQGLVSGQFYDFNGEGSSTNRSPAFVFAKAGLKEIRQRVSGAGGEAWATNTIVIQPRYEAPVIITGSVIPQRGRAPLTVRFAARVSGDYRALQWTVGNRLVSTNLELVMKFNQAQNVRVRFEVLPTDPGQPTASRELVEFGIRDALDRWLNRWSVAAGDAQAREVDMATFLSANQLGSVDVLRSRLTPDIPEAVFLSDPAQKAMVLKLPDPEFLAKGKSKLDRFATELEGYESAFAERVEGISAGLEAVLDEQCKHWLTQGSAMAQAQLSALRQGIKELKATANTGQANRDQERQSLTDRIEVLIKKINYWGFGLDGKYRRAYLTVVNAFLALRVQERADAGMNECLRRFERILVSKTAEVQTLVDDLQIFRETSARCCEELVAQGAESCFVQSVIPPCDYPKWAAENRVEVPVDLRPNSLKWDAFVGQAVETIARAYLSRKDQFDLAAEALKDEPTLARVKTIDTASNYLMHMELTAPSPAQLSPEKFLAGCVTGGNSGIVAEFRPPEGGAQVIPIELTNRHIIICSRTIHGIPVTAWSGFEEADGYYRQDSWWSHALADFDELPPLRPLSEERSEALRTLGLGLCFELVHSRRSYYYKNVSWEELTNQRFLRYYRKDLNTGGTALVNTGLVLSAPASQTKVRQEDLLGRSLSESLAALSKPETGSFKLIVNEVLDEFATRAGVNELKKVIEDFVKGGLDRLIHQATDNRTEWEEVARELRAYANRLS